MRAKSRYAKRAGRTDLAQRAPVVTFRIQAEARKLRLLRRLVREAALECGCGDGCVRDIVIAVDEACQNVIRHGYGEGTSGELIVEVRCDDENIAFSIVDFAPPVDPHEVRPRDLGDLRPGGLGTHFINECMDDWSFREPPPGAGNCLWMTKKID